MDNSIKIKLLCTEILQNPENCGHQMKAIEELLKLIPQHIAQHLMPTMLCVYHPILKNISENKYSYSEKEKIQFLSTLTSIFHLVRVDKIGLFFNFYSFLLFEIYDHNKHKVNSISEEYKLSILECTTTLVKSLSWDTVSELYKKENAPRLCQLLYVAVEVSKTEQMKSLRIAAMECILSFARVHDEEDANDAELRNNVADIFMLFLPGIASGMTKILLEEEKSGHKVITKALTTWARILSVVLDDYDAADSVNIGPSPSKILINVKENTAKQSSQDIEQYIKKTKRTSQWYAETDENLYKMMCKFSRLLQYTHPKVRYELGSMCTLLIEKCMKTAPKCAGQGIHFLIALSEDEDENVRNLVCSTLETLSDKFHTERYLSLLENLEEKFYNTINSLPRHFNRKDTNEQLNAINLIIGYVRLFGKHQLHQVLLSPTYLNQFLLTLLHICEIEKTEVQSVEEYAIIDLEHHNDKTPWKRFYYFINGDSVHRNLELIPSLLCSYGAVEVVSDFLLNVFLNDLEHKCEATFLLNELFSGQNIDTTSFHIAKNIISNYVEPSNWNLPLITADSSNLSTVRCNIIQVCLQTEGIGKFAVTLQKDFNEFLLKTLYLILERAGSANPLVRLAGTKALSNIMKACEYQNVTELVNINSDYFSFHVIRKLNRSEENESVLNVLGVVMSQSSVDVLPSISNITEVVLTQSCDKFKEQHASAYLRIFKIFIKCLWRWFNISVKIYPIKSKLQKEKEFEEFKISNMNYSNDFSDDIMGKTAEEMYKEDLARGQNALEDEVAADEEYKKPDPPLHIKITVAILKRSLHFLPSKIKTRKILVLEILSDGLEVIRDWEDELLPIVHQIWSPLVDRFREHDEPLVINLSFKLLVVLARLSKDFIRSRTAKDVLPQITSLLTKQAHESLLKDRGSSYRYTQAYKMQLVVLQNLACVLTDLDMTDAQIEVVMDAATPYLSAKQPVPLQEACIEFFTTLAKYDNNLVNIKIQKLRDNNSYCDFEKNVLLIKSTNSYTKFFFLK